ncbi:hypothetical protein RUND412_004754 [Rhizina undulata]
MMDAAVKSFFSSPQFAVVGVSASPTKFGYKVLSWYLNHSLPVTAIKPNSPPILSHQPISSLSELPAPDQTSISIITPPKATLEVLKEALNLGVKNVWFQPGAADKECVEFAREAGMEVVDGYCILADGERGLREAGRLGKL